MRIASSITLGLIIGLAALAQEPPPENRQQGRDQEGGRFQRPSIGFMLLDTNRDGVLDASEIAAAPAVLAKLDTNTDGQVTSDELRAAMPRRGPGGPGQGSPREGGPGRGGESQGPNMADDMVKTLMSFDANGDGKLSKSELPQRYQGIFDRADENKDGFLTPDEIRKALAAQAPPQGGPAGRGGPEGERGERGEGQRGEGQRREFNFVKMDAILSAIDANGDGVLSADEIKNSSKALRKFDKDGDGTVTRDEVMSSIPQARPI